MVIGATVAAVAVATVASAGQVSAESANGDLGSTSATRSASVARPAASTGYFNTYTTVATLGNANSCYAAEGFAVGSSYTYAVKINGDESKAVIYRTRMSDGTTTLMKNGDNGTSYASYLGHANDVVLSSNDGNYYMFVVTMKAGSTSVVKLKYVSTTYYKVGSYTIKYNGVNKSMSGVKITSKTASTINFLFKSGRTFYRGALGLTATSGTINLTAGFTLDVADALVNGKTVPDITSYANQGFGYHSNTVYFPMTHENVSVVLVYRNISSASGTIRSADDLSFRITSSAYPDLFEIESVGIGAGSHLWFSTNRRKAAGDTAHDGVHYFNGYTA
ncbi:hypothetical protein Athai_49180 [Actinocatenispora thailandica]|uniref:Uncharacterized protein n=2 Tax=Actinocatenispora thailandica TaxID=227318 RepID=A0A7R7DTJ8_9ACTN|nr:hypothetical protein Athai_49180 [Actinocatenispora thailandica]